MKSKIMLSFALFLAMPPVFAGQIQYMGTRNLAEAQQQQFAEQQQYSDQGEFVSEEEYAQNNEQQKAQRQARRYRVPSNAPNMNYNTGYDQYGKPTSNVQPQYSNQRNSQNYRPQQNRSMAKSNRRYQPTYRQNTNGTIYGGGLYSDEAQNLNRIYVDLAPLIGSGVGIAYERVFLSKIAVGPYASMFKITKDGSDLKNDTQVFGVRGKYFIDGNADENSFYGLVGGQQTTVKTSGDVYKELRKENNSYFFSRSEKTLSVSKSEFGAVVGAGYQLAPSGFGRTKFLMNFAGLYGHGNAVETQATYSSSTGPALDNTIKYDFYFEASFGLMF